MVRAGLRPSLALAVRRAAHHCAWHWQWQWQASSRSFFLFICARVRPSFLARHSSSLPLSYLCDIFMLQHAQFTSAKSADSCLQTGNSNLSFGQGGTFNDRNGFLSCCPQTLSSRTHTHTASSGLRHSGSTHTHSHSRLCLCT